MIDGLSEVGHPSVARNVLAGLGLSVSRDTVLLERRTTLQDGHRVRLRLPRHGDGAALRALARRLGVDADEVELARALKFDPRRRAVVCATAWVDGHETVVGWAAMDVGADEPDTLMADVALAPGLGRLLHAAVLERAADIRAA